MQTFPAKRIIRLPSAKRRSLITDKGLPMRRASASSRAPSRGSGEAAGDADRSLRARSRACARSPSRSRGGEGATSIGTLLDAGGEADTDCETAGAATTARDLTRAGRESPRGATDATDAADGSANGAAARGDGNLSVSVKAGIG